MMHRLWHSLTRPRTLRSRAPLQRVRRRRSGVALLVAITTMLVLSVLVSELAYIARVRFLISYHQRDRAQAYWLARSGVNLYVLILSADKEIGKQIESFVGDMGIDSLWQMVPVINTGLMRMLFTGDSASDFSEEDLATFQATGQVSAEIADASRDDGSVFDDRNFLDFDGDFSAEVSDNEGKIDVNQFDGETGTLQESPIALQLYALMSGEENDAWFVDKGLDRWEIIGNLRDWIDADNVRASGTGGYEDNLYNTQDPPYLAKNAPLDTLEEIRLVEGWQDDVMDRFGSELTIWSNGKNNPASFSRERHIATILSATSTTWESVEVMCFSSTDEEYGLAWWQGGSWKNAKEYAADASTGCGMDIESSALSSLNFTNKSRVFTVVSTGLVGTSEVTITAVIDYTKKNTGDVVYWRVD